MTTLHYLDDRMADSFLSKEATLALERCLTKGHLRGNKGWNRPEECPKHHLQTLMDDAAEAERWDLVACYANMLYVRQLAGEK